MAFDRHGALLSSILQRRPHVVGVKFRLADDPSVETDIILRGYLRILESSEIIQDRFPDVSTESL